MSTSDLPLDSPVAARGGDADEHRSDVLGPQILLRFSAALRTARTHDVSNQAFQRQLQELLAVIAALHKDEDECALVAVADYFYLDGHRIKASATLLPVYHGMLGEFERRGV